MIHWDLKSEIVILFLFLILVGNNKYIFLLLFIMYPKFYVEAVTLFFKLN